MALHDAIVVGSGLAGTFAAYGLRGRDVVVLDVGYRPPPAAPLEGNLYGLRKSREDLFDLLIGQNFEGLHNIHRRAISLKLKSPGTSFIVKNGETFCPLVSPNFEPMASFAQGGLANAWGAGVYRFTARDLEGFPLRPGELDPYYDELTQHVGVSGANDDLAPFFGRDSNLLPPLRLSGLAADLLKEYAARREFCQRRGVYLGYPRLAVLTREHNGRPPYGYENLEFFRAHNPAIYNPVFTLDELDRTGQVQLRRGYLVRHYREDREGIEVTATRLSTGETERFQARKLFLAAGTLNTARLALASNADTGHRLPILDNPMSCMPLFRLRRIGSALDVHDSSMGQLNILYDDPRAGVMHQGTLYATTGPLRSDILFQFPLAISASLAWSKYLAPAMGLVILFHPGAKRPENYIKLNASGQLEACYAPEAYPEVEAGLLRVLRKCGLLGFTSLCVRPPMGNGIHYAGTLPMRAQPGPYETGPDGLLFGGRRVYVVDGASFPALPAKNLSFTIMANALRVAAQARRELET
jgi:choline dehydrogenase-like flavoprotein